MCRNGDFHGMTKRLICIFLVVLTVFACIPSLAYDSNSIYTDFKFYRARVYVCDTEKKEIVLKNVSPLNVMDGMTGARDIEYRAIGVNTVALFEKNGNKLSLDVINGYLLDMDALVLVGRCGYGYRVLYLEV